jgi:hypothetical protein
MSKYKDATEMMLIYDTKKTLLFVLHHSVPITQNLSTKTHSPLPIGLHLSTVLLATHFFLNIKGARLRTQRITVFISWTRETNSWPGHNNSWPPHTNSCTQGNYLVRMKYRFRVFWCHNQVVDESGNV